jgi:uncharacterized paraquat-inducible protein A
MKLPSNIYINKSTNEQIHKSIEICTKCHLNFTTAALEMHQDANCGNPKILKLVKLRNKYGSIVYKHRNDPDPIWKFEVLLH